MTEKKETKKFGWTVAFFVLFVAAMCLMLIGAVSWLGQTFAEKFIISPTPEEMGDRILTIAWSPAYTSEDRLLAAGSNDHSIILMNAVRPEVWHRLQAHTDQVHSVAFSPDGKTLASGSGDGTVILWNVQTGAVIHSLEGHNDKVTSLSFNPHGLTLASGAWDNKVIMWQADTGEMLGVWEEPGHRVLSVAFSPNGVKIASGSSDGTVLLRDVLTGQVRDRLEGHLGGVMGVAFSPDGTTLAAGAIGKRWGPHGGLTEGAVTLWDVQGGQLLHTFQSRTRSSIRDVVFSPDGTTVAAVSFETIEADSARQEFTSVVYLWEIKTGRLLHRLKRTGSSSISFSPNGRQLASAGLPDNAVIVWDVQSGKKLHTWIAKSTN